MNTLILSGVLLNLAFVCFARYPVNRQERERLRNNRFNLHHQVSNTGSSIHGGFDPNLQQINRHDRIRDNRFDSRFQPIVNDRFASRADSHVVDPVIHDTVDISQVRQVGNSRRHPVSNRPRGSNVDRNIQNFGWSSLDSILPPSLINQFRNQNVHNPKPTPIVKGNLPKPKENKPIVDQNTNDWQPPLVPGGLDLNGPLGPLDGLGDQGPVNGQIVPIGQTKPTDKFKTGQPDAGWNPNDSLPPIFSGVTLGPLGLDVGTQTKKGQTVPVIPLKPIDKSKTGNTDALNKPDILWKAGGLDGGQIPPELGLPGLNNPLIPEKLPKDKLPLPGGLNQNSILPKQTTDLPPTDFDHLFGLPPIPDLPGSPSTSMSSAGATAGSNSNLIPPVDNLPAGNNHGSNTDLLPPLPPLDQGTGAGSTTDSLDAFLADFEAGLFDLPPAAGNTGPVNPNDPLIPPIGNSQFDIGGKGGSNQQLDLGGIAGLFEAHPEADPGPQAVSNAAKTVKENQPPKTPGLLNKNNQTPKQSGQNKGTPAQSQAAAAARTEAGKITEGLTGEALLKSLQGLAARLAPSSTTTTEAPTTKFDKRALLRNFGRRRNFNG